MRIKGGVKARKRHNKYQKMAEGYRGGRGLLYRSVREAVERGLDFAFRDRRQRKRDFRKLWIIRINAAARECGLSYSRMMDGLRKANVDVDRKMLADMAVMDKAGFAALAATAKAAVA
jgi:large subunit ribosomal protein L20